MSPNELARTLNRIASAIENSRSPSRELVARDLRRILANLDPMMAEEGMHDDEHVGEEMHEAAGVQNLLIGIAAAAALTGCSESLTKANAEAIKQAAKEAHMEIGTGHDGALKAGEHILEAFAFPGAMTTRVLSDFKTCSEQWNIETGHLMDTPDDLFACAGGVLGSEGVKVIWKDGKLQTPEGKVFDITKPYMP